MKKSAIIISLVLPFVWLHLHAQVNYHLNGPFEYILNVAPLADGSVIAVGEDDLVSSGEPSFAKILPNGTVAWHKKFNAPLSSSWCVDVMGLQDTSFILAWEDDESNRILSRMDKNGNHLWSLDIHDVGTSYTGTLIMMNDSVFWFYDVIGPGSNLYVGAFKTDGTTLWQKQYANPSPGTYQASRSGVRLQDGSVVLMFYLFPTGGWGLIHLDGTGSIVKTKMFSYTDRTNGSLFLAQDGNILITGYIPGVTYTHLTVTKIDPAFNQVWGKKFIFPGGETMRGTTIGETNDKRIFVRGHIETLVQVNPLILELDSLGNLLGAMRDLTVDLDIYNEAWTRQAHRMSDGSVLFTHDLDIFKISSLSHLCGMVPQSINQTNDPGGSATVTWGSAAVSTPPVPSVNTVTSETYTSPGTCISCAVNSSFTGPDTICAGEPALFTAIAGSGHEWLVDGVSSDTGATLSWVFASPGVYTLSHIGGGIATCTDTTSATVVVTGPSVPAITPIGGACDGDPVISLTASPSGGTWSGPGVSGSTFDPGIGSGTYTIIYTLSSGGCSPADTVAITVSSTPSIALTPVDTLCEDALPVSLLASPAGGAWSGTGVSGASFDPAAGPGSFTVHYTYTNGFGCTNQDSMNIVVASLPVLTLDTLGEIGDCDPVAPLVASPAGGTWSGSGVSGSTFDPSIGAGSYTLYYSFINSAGCEAMDSIMVTVTVCAEIQPSSPLMTGMVYPNPATDFIIVKLPVLMNGKPDFSLWNSLGQEEHVSEIIELSPQEYKIGISKIHSGIYLIKAGEWRRKIVKL